MSNPYLFIVGCPRSGTTLLRRMVDAHPQIAVLPETHWIPRLVRSGPLVTPGGRVTHELVDCIVADPGFRRLKLELDEVRALLDGGVKYAEFVAALFDLYARKRGKRLAGEKTPGYVAELPLLHALFPNARFVHLIRDGRDVCLSALSWERKRLSFERRLRTWRDDPVVTAALWWKSFVSLGHDYGATLPPDLYYELHYEELVARPEQACRRLCAFLDTDYDDQMIRFHEGKTKTTPGLSAKRAWLPITTGLRDWRTQLAPDELEAFEAAAGDLLDELGYERAVPDPVEAARSRATRVAVLCSRDLPRSQPAPAGVV